MKGPQRVLKTLMPGCKVMGVEINLLAFVLLLQTGQTMLNDIFFVLFLVKIPRLSKEITRPFS